MSADWISIKDRQPKEGDVVLLVIKYFCDYDGILPGEWRQHVYQAGVNQDVMRSNVTHWMPLPAPPEL